MAVVIYTDGGSRNNPGEAGAGFVIYKGEKKLDEGLQYLGIQTNNWAEYEAVALALAKAHALGLESEEIEVRLDSKLVAEQLSDRWKIKEPSLKPQAEKVRGHMQHFKHVRFTHIPREKNTEADALANEAMDRGE